MGFSNNLRAARKAHGWTQDDLAKILQSRGIKASRPTVNTWETGRHEPSAATIKVVAEVLGVTVDELLETSVEEFVAWAPHARKLLAPDGVSVGIYHTPAESPWAAKNGDNNWLNHEVSSCQTYSAESVAKMSQMWQTFLDRVSQRSEEEQSKIVVLGCQESERLDMLYRLSEADSKHLAILSSMADMDAEAIANLRSLAMLDPVKIKALCVLSGISGTK